MPNTVVGIPTIQNVTMTLADTEYYADIPAGTFRFSLQTRDGTAFRIAFATGKVATPTEPYITIREGGAYNSPDAIQISSSDLRIYFGCDSASKVIELITWPKA